VAEDAAAAAAVTSGSEIGVPRLLRGDVDRVAGAETDLDDLLALAFALTLTLLLALAYAAPLIIDVDE
jgi:hypothetical protein